MHVTSINIDTKPIYEKNNDTLEIHDKTNGLATVFLINQCQQKTYGVLINKKMIVFPVSQKKTFPQAIFTGSKKMSFEYKEDVVQISEVDQNGTNVYYVDIKQSLSIIFFFVYPYIPKDIGNENTLKKISNMKNNFPNFHPKIVCYNRHGVAVFGSDLDKKHYSLFWGSPSEEINYIECSKCSVFQDQDGLKKINAKSKNGIVCFQYSEKKHNINHENGIELFFERNQNLSCPEKFQYDHESFLPMEIGYEYVLQKIRNMFINFPNFNPKIALNNQYGLYVVGWDNEKKSYALYGANPFNEIEFIKCQNMLVKINQTCITKIFAKSEILSFDYSFGEKRLLNQEYAIKLKFKDQFCFQDKVLSSEDIENFLDQNKIFSRRT